MGLVDVVDEVYQLTANSEYTPPAGSTASMWSCDRRCKQNLAANATLKFLTGYEGLKCTRQTLRRLSQRTPL